MIRYSHRDGALSQRRQPGRPLRLERLEPRLLLAGDTYLINFQLGGAPIPNRYLADTGLVFGDRGGGLSYGWSSDHTDQSRDRNLVADQRLDTLIHFEVGQSWEFQLPNGAYAVTVSIGDAQFDSTYTLNVEGVNYWSALPLAPGDFRMQTQQIAVADGRLTLNQGAAPDKATRINYVHIVGLPSGPNAAPGAPTITEPAPGAAPLNPADVHMEAVGFSDPDGNAHKSTDWEIWSTGPGAAAVWQTLGITGVERLHTHLGDGIFVGTHAGRTSLLANTSYELRARFRDDAGSVSGYATRTFQTGAASTVFPLLLEDVAATPAPRWTDANSNNVVLPLGTPDQPELRLTSASGDLLLAFTGSDGVMNAVTNPAPLFDHAALRVVITGGSSGLGLGQTKLTFRNEHQLGLSVFLPAINLAPGQRLDLWAAVDGSTYYGTAADTEPNFSNLARQAELPLPFIALQPGFEIDVVAGGLQLPTNIAFVPNPGPNPNDPLFYVTELYGTIKVVTNDFTMSNYATGLLNFNPTGNFPGSGEQGLAGIAIDPLTGDVFATRVTSSIPGVEAAPHYPQVLRFTSNDGGRTAASMTVIRDMVGETQGQSHQISNVTIGPDGKLYVHMGDGFDYTTAQNLDSYRGKILRMNLDGSAPTDNPFYNAANGINARDYVFAYGVRNPFGGAWRAADGKHYEVENGPSVDRMAQINRGVNYGWNNTDASMTINAIYNWNPSHAPVNIAFVQPATFGGSQFPAAMQDRAYVSESGPTYATGPQSRGKRIVEFVLDANGNRLSGPTTLVEYVGTGKGTVVGLAAGPDGLYFTELYKDQGAVTPIDAGARVFRVRYVNPLAGDYDINGVVNDNDLTVWQANFGSTHLLAADGNRDGVVDAADYVVWRKNLGASLAASAMAGTSAMASLTEVGVATSVSDVGESSVAATATSLATGQPRSVPAPQGIVASRSTTRTVRPARSFAGHSFSDQVGDESLLSVVDAQTAKNRPSLHSDDVPWFAEPRHLPGRPSIRLSQATLSGAIDEAFAALAES